MTIKIINHSNNPLPRYESEQAAGMDIRCHLAEPVTLQPLPIKTRSPSLNSTSA